MRTGASGVGKTYLAQVLERELDPKFVSIECFDSIGVPGFEDMTREYGSGEKWQEAMTHKWVEKLIQTQDKTVVVLEGQFNPQFAVDACRKFGHRQYAIILLRADKGTREHRLIKHRAQPELADETMDNWAEFLKLKTQHLGGIIIDTSNSNLQSSLNQIADLIKAEIQRRIPRQEQTNHIL